MKKGICKNKIDKSVVLNSKIKNKKTIKINKSLNLEKINVFKAAFSV